MPCIWGVKTRQRLLCHRAGHTGAVQVSDIAALPIRLGAAVRRRRLFHPDGVLAEGTFERVAAPIEGLPMVSCHVIARVSKGSPTTDPEVQLIPVWLSDFRRAAYGRSREGRDTAQ